MHIKIIHETTAALLLSSSPCHGLQASSYYYLVNIQAKFFSKIVDTTSKKSLMRENQKPILVNFHLLFFRIFHSEKSLKKIKIDAPFRSQEVKNNARALNRLTQYLWSFESRYQFAISATQL